MLLTFPTRQICRIEELCARKGMGEGKIYLFNTVGDHRIYKAGHTQQEALSSRLKGYLGPSKPRVLVACRDVDDSARAEEMLLRLLRHSSIVSVRADLGREWFESVSEIDHDERHRTMRFIMDVVQQAVASRVRDDVTEPVCTAPSPPVTEPRAATCATSLPAMNAYFECLDQFVATAPSRILSAGIADVVDAFDRSEACPVFVEYLMWSFDARVAVARNRLPHMG